MCERRETQYRTTPYLALDRGTGMCYSVLMGTGSLESAVPGVVSYDLQDGGVVVVTQ